MSLYRININSIFLVVSSNKSLNISTNKEYTIKSTILSPFSYAYDLQSTCTGDNEQSKLSEINNKITNIGNDFTCFNFKNKNKTIDKVIFLIKSKIGKLTTLTTIPKNNDAKKKIYK